MRFLRLLIFVFFLKLTSSCSSFKKDISSLDLGSKNLKQSITLKKLEKGVTYVNINRGYVSSEDFYTLSSNVLDLKKQIPLINTLKSLDYEPTIKFINCEGDITSKYSLISIGKYATKEKATLVQKQLEKDSVFLRIRHSSEDSKQKFGPFQMSLLKINLNKFSGSIKSVLANNFIQKTGLTSEVYKSQKNVIAAVNGGFFVMKDKDGTVGDLAGISVIDGELVSEAVNGRSALVIDNSSRNKLFIAHNVKTNLSLSINNKTFAITGVNRKPNAILNCGNKVFATQIPPIHDFRCLNPNEIILFKHSFGKKNEVKEGINFIIDRERNIIKSVNSFNSGYIAKNEYLVQATGIFSKQLLPLVKKGDSVVVNEQISSEEGELQLKKGIYIVNGGPTLLKNYLHDASMNFNEGWQVDMPKNMLLGANKSIDRASFYNNWVLKRNPRTAFGLDDEGNAYFLVVYGRDPNKSVGVSIYELASIMKKLNTKEALNLDGGGSSVMIVDNKKTGRPSDTTGERKVGDVIVILSNK